MAIPTAEEIEDGLNQDQAQNKPKPAEASRKQPKTDVLRELYLKSGNLCAFPDCRHTIVDADGVYIANLCHIEAAEKGGPRFNSTQTDEDRRSFENLLLMCHAHHKITDDEIKFPVEKLKEFKREHEAKFSHIIDDLAGEVYDTSKVHQFKAPTNLLRFLKYNGSQEDEDLRVEIDKLAQRLQKLSPATRKMFCIFVNHCDGDNAVNILHFFTLSNLNLEDTIAHVKILDDTGLIWNDDNSELYERKFHLSSKSMHDYPTAALLRDFCQENQLDLEAIMVRMDFTLLDE